MGVVYEVERVSDFTHFSVKGSYMIGGSMHRPSICYPIPDSLAPSIEALEKAGRATRYKEDMIFINGIARPAKAPKKNKV